MILFVWQHSWIPFLFLSVYFKALSNSNLNFHRREFSPESKISSDSFPWTIDRTCLKAPSTFPISRTWGIIQIKEQKSPLKHPRISSESRIDSKRPTEHHFDFPTRSLANPESFGGRKIEINAPSDSPPAQPSHCSTLFHIVPFLFQYNEVRTVILFHYTEWPCHSNPFSNALLEFRRRVRNVMNHHPDTQDGPVIVHCKWVCLRIFGGAPVPRLVLGLFTAVLGSLKKTCFQQFTNFRASAAFPVSFFSVVSRFLSSQTSSPNPSTEKFVSAFLVKALQHACMLFAIQTIRSKES